MKRMMTVLALSLYLGASAAWAIDETPTFPMDFSANCVSGGNSTFVIVGGNVLAVSVNHADASEDAYAVDVESGHLSDPSGNVIVKGSDDFAGKLDTVIGHLEVVRTANPEDAEKIDSTIDYLTSWRA